MSAMQSAESSSNRSRIVAPFHGSGSDLAASVANNSSSMVCRRRRHHTSCAQPSSLRIARVGVLLDPAIVGSGCEYLLWSSIAPAGNSYPMVVSSTPSSAAKHSRRLVAIGPSPSLVFQPGVVDARPSLYAVATSRSTPAPAFGPLRLCCG